ncbi:MAG: putative selenium-dependent hydroxylase accessory protein YqeC [Anaerolineales bacterium]|nr:putative selenium-dependent hydroxylase accessory protein YqeC [Anaerolineales bacterium]
MILSLAQALRVGPAPRIAFIGAGGKTTAMFRLAKQLPSPVMVTATSHLGAWQTGQADQHIIAETPAPLEELEHGSKGVILVTGARDGDRVQPVGSHLMDWLKQYCDVHSMPLLIEADGSREKPLKAWAEHEPPIPAFVEMVLQIVGLTGLGQPLNDENVHRPEIFSKLSGLRPDQLITPDALVRVLTHAEGGLRNIPENARSAVLLNQADTPELQSAAQGLAHALIPAYQSAIIASLKQEMIFAVHEPVAGIVLAAGGSTRFGQPKQLLDWKGQPFIRVAATTALEAGLSPVVVVTGANAEQIESTIKDLNVIIVRNEVWQSGQGSSIRAGIRSLPPPGLPQIRQQVSSLYEKNLHDVFGGGARRVEGVGAAIFLLADQPQITTSILRALAEKHAEGLYPIVAPMVMDQRANPVLFDCLTFPDLLELEGDVGGRGIFHKHPVEYLPWHDDRLLLDVDTPEMYKRLITDDTL